MSAAPHSTSAGTPTWPALLDLDGPVPAIWSPSPAPHSGRARILARLHREPLGYLEAPLHSGELRVTDVVEATLQQYGDAIERHLCCDYPDGPPGATRLPLPARPAGCVAAVDDELAVSVVVCTRDRPAILRNCLEALRGLTYPNLEIVVVDNAPRGEAVKTVFDNEVGRDPRFRYVQEPAPGLSRARNCGVRAADGDVVAFTDDDVVVDPYWVEGLVRGFRRRSDVDCVTGLVCPTSLSASAEVYFDTRMSWSRFSSPEIFDITRSHNDSLYPYSPGMFGTGANFACRRRVLLDLGGFDERLGAGTGARGGEDLDMFVRVVLAGKAIAYEPAAMVWHAHRHEPEALQSQMFSYGVGFAAFFTKHVLDKQTRGRALRCVPAGLRRLLRVAPATSQSLAQARRMPRGLLAREFAGYAAGPLLYLREHHRLHLAAEPRPRSPFWAARADWSHRSRAR